MASLPTAENISKIRVLFRAPDTLTLYGVPYEMREGQAPRDIFVGPFKDRFVGEWVYLGEPGWFGLADAAQVKLAKQFIEALKLTDDVPSGSYEWVRLKRESEG